jgi:glutathione S-transferase
LARKFNLAGKGDREEAEVDMYADQVSDLLNLVIAAFMESDETRKAEAQRKLAEETVPAHLALFENRLIKTGSGFLASSGLTFADFYLTLMLDWLGEKREAALARFPHVKQLAESVNSHPNIAAWIAKRPVTAM